MPQPWRDQASSESYPFKPGLAKTSGAGEIQDRDFLDLSIVASAPVWLRSLEISSGGFTGELEASDGEVFTFEGEDFDGGEYQIETSSGRVCGVVVLGDDDLFLRLPAGTHLFPQGLVEVIDSLVMPKPPGVSSMSIPGVGTVFGRVRIEAGDGVSIEYSEEGDSCRLRIHADGAVDGSGCAGSAIKTINGVPPGEAGGILISESSFEVPGSDAESRQIFRVYPASNGIKVQLVDPDA